MKKFFTILLCALVGLQSISQQQVSFGSIREDGYQNITPGALWAKRPEAKKIFNGENVVGFTAYRLKEQFLARFIPSEHNSRDNNYIVFPVGAIVYKNDVTADWFAAKCGNQFEYLKPLIQVVIIDRPVRDTIRLKSEEKIVEKCYNNLVVNKTTFISKLTGLSVEVRYDTVGVKNDNCENIYFTSAKTEYVDERSTCFTQQMVCGSCRRNPCYCQPPHRSKFFGYVQVAYRGRQMMPSPQPIPQPRGIMGGGRSSGSSSNHGNMGGGLNNNGGNMGPGRGN